MRIWGLCALFFVCISGVSRAQDESDTSALNAVWSAYVAAMKQPHVDVQIGAAEAVLVAGRKAMDPTDERLPVLMANMGVALLLGNRKEDARTVLEEALEVGERIHGKNSAALVNTLAYLGDAESAFLQPGRQLKYYKRALKIVATQQGRDSDEYADFAFRTGLNVSKLSRSAAGKKYFLEAQEIFSSRHGKQSEKYGLVTFHLAKLEFAKGNNNKAVEYALAALPTFAGDDEDKIDYQLYARALLVQAYEASGESDLATEHCITIGKISMLRPEQDYQPLFRMAPRYPAELLMSRIEGYVDLTYTIDKSGFVQQAQVADMKATRGGRRASLSRQKARALEQAALKAAERFRYAPMFVDGEAVETNGIKTRISFELE